MLNLHRLAPGAESYYLDQVVSGVEDYYAEAGESPGYWLASTHLLGLDGVVDGDDLRAVLSGHDPRPASGCIAQGTARCPAGT